MLNDIQNLLDAINKFEQQFRCEIYDAGVEGYFHDMKSDISARINDLSDDLPSVDGNAEHRLTKSELGLL